MRAYDYDAYAGSGAEPPIVRIGIGVHPEAADGGAEYRLDWSWETPVQIALGNEIVVSVMPFTAGWQPSSPSWRAGRFGLVAWGRCTAQIRRWGATLPLDMMDPRVIAALREAETVEAMRWLVVGHES